MNTVARAWQAAMLALTEALELRVDGGNVETIRELLQHAREMMDVIEEEITEERVLPADPDVIRMAAAEMRKRVEAAAATLAPLH